MTQKQKDKKMNKLEVQFKNYSLSQNVILKNWSPIEVSKTENKKVLFINCKKTSLAKILNLLSSWNVFNYFNTNPIFQAE